MGDRYTLTDWVILSYEICTVLSNSPSDSEWSHIPQKMNFGMTRTILVKDKHVFKARDVHKINHHSIIQFCIYMCILERNPSVSAVSILFVATVTIVYKYIAYTLGRFIQPIFFKMFLLRFLYLQFLQNTFHVNTIHVQVLPTKYLLSNNTIMATKLLKAGLWVPNFTQDDRYAW